MFYLLAIAAFTAPPLELHTHPGSDGRYIRACIVRDVYVVDERTGVIRYYQESMRPLIVHRDTAGDNFLTVGRTRTQFPPMAMDSQGMLILFVKRELDQHNREHKTYETRPDYSPSHVAQYGMLNLGSGPKRLKPLPMVWKRYELTAWTPQIQE